MRAEAAPQAAFCRRHKANGVPPETVVPGRLEVLFFHYVTKEIVLFGYFGKRIGRGSSNANKHSGTAEGFGAGKTDVNIFTKSFLIKQKNIFRRQPNADGVMFIDFSVFETDTDLFGKSINFFSRKIA